MGSTIASSMGASPEITGALEDFAVKFNGLSMSPNPNLAPMMERRQARREQSASRNQTAEYLKQAGRADLAQLVQAGALDGSSALEMAMQTSDPQIMNAGDGNIIAIDPRSRKVDVLYEAKAGAKDERPALIQTYEYARGTLGMTHEEAVAFARSQTPTTNQYPAPQAGYMWEFDEQGRPVRQTAIEGSKAWFEEQQAIRAEQEKAAAAERARLTGVQSENKYGGAALRTVDQIIERLDPNSEKTIGRPYKGSEIPATGQWGRVLRDVPVLGGMAPGADVKKLFDGMKGFIAFDRLQAMRAASPTGGALGAVSDAEMNLLQTALGVLDPDVNDLEGITLPNLYQVRAILEKFAAYPDAAAGGAPAPPAPAPAADGFGVTGEY